MQVLLSLYALVMQYSYLVQSDGQVELWCYGTKHVIIFIFCCFNSATEAWQSHDSGIKYCINLCGSLPTNNACSCNGAAICRIDAANQATPQNIGNFETAVELLDGSPDAETWLSFTGETCAAGADPQQKYKSVFYLKCGKNLVSLVTALKLKKVLNC